MEFLTPLGPEQIDYWSVSLGQDAIGTPETVKERRLELTRRFALAANVLDEQTAQLKEQAAQIQKVSAQLAAASPSRGGLEANEFAAGRIRGGGPATQTVLTINKKQPTRRAKAFRCAGSRKADCVW